ncbi:hypothetical protein [Halorussus sp. MSC15.2]|uniref:hypothetical protein n=1 Tax=Halorussus sp. MSC15.2 TaxID=2283638 RepID=UPI001F0831C5|nr:hypothetical protein [Halorussus sp. MSC15.2]
MPGDDSGTSEREPSESDSTAQDLTDAEREALHELQVGIEHVRRGYGRLLDCHHQVGRGMDRFDAAREKLREAGHDELADELRDSHLPAGAVGDQWTYQLVETFEAEFLATVSEFEASVREQLADGENHVTERKCQREWRDRADGEDWRKD